MLVLAHRGANRVAPENSVAAMVEAVGRGADGVELDVHRSADGALVVRHDAQTPAGAVGELAVAELRAALGEVAVLEEVLDVCRGRLVNVEVKDPDPRATDALVAILAERRGSGVGDDVLVSSFHLEVVERVRAAAPEVPTGCLSFGVPPDDALLVARQGGHGAVHPDVWTVLGLDDVAAFVGRAHALDVRVHVWTVNDVDQLRTLRDAGVDAVFTDDTELYGYGVRGRAG